MLLSWILQAQGGVQDVMQQGIAGVCMACDPTVSLSIPYRAGQAVARKERRATGKKGQPFKGAQQNCVADSFGMLRGQTWVLG